MMQTFRVYSEPVAQGRPRACYRNGRVIMYDPQKSRSWKDTIISQVLDSKLVKIEPDVAIEMNVKFFIKKPKYLGKKTAFAVKRPDLSNYIKGLEDALNGILYHDDAQIVRLSISKEYETERDPPGCEIEIQTMKGE